MRTERHDGGLDLSPSSCCTQGTTLGGGSFSPSPICGRMAVRCRVEQKGGNMDHRPRMMIGVHCHLIRVVAPAVAFGYLDVVMEDLRGYAGALRQQQQLAAQQRRGDLDDDDAACLFLMLPIALPPPLRHGTLMCNNIGGNSSTGGGFLWNPFEAAMAVEPARCTLAAKLSDPSVPIIEKLEWIWQVDQALNAFRRLKWNRTGGGTTRDGEDKEEGDRLNFHGNVVPDNIFLVDATQNESYHSTLVAKLGPPQFFSRDFPFVASRRYSAPQLLQLLPNPESLLPEPALAACDSFSVASLMKDALMMTLPHRRTHKSPRNSFRHHEMRNLLQDDDDESRRCISASFITQRMEQAEGAPFMSEHIAEVCAYLAQFELIAASQELPSQKAEKTAAPPASCFDLLPFPLSFPHFSW